MNQQTSSLILAGLLLGFVAVPQASAKTAKDCIAEWRADKAGMQARGTTEKAYVDQCKDGAAPTAAAPGATPSAASPKTATGGPSQKSAKDCTAEWRADKAGMQARGTTEKDYVEQCKGGAEPTVAAPIVPKPSATTPAPTTPAPTAQKSAPPSSTPAPRQASTPKESDSKSGQFADEAQAKARCPGDTVVWANLSSKVYHFSGGKTYGNTKRGAYMCEKEAMTADFRASKNEKHP